MTNHIHAKAEYIEGAWRAMVRYAHRADYWPIMDGHRPAGFPSKEAAEIAALRAQEKHLNGTITGFCARSDHARETAEQLFRPGKTPIPVDHKAGRKPFQVLTGRAGR